MGGWIGSGFTPYIIQRSPNPWKISSKHLKGPWWLNKLCLWHPTPHDPFLSEKPLQWLFKIAYNPAPYLSLRKVFLPNNAEYQLSIILKLYSVLNIEPV